MTQPTKTEFQKVADAVATLDKRLELARKETEVAGGTAAKVEQGHEKTRDLVTDLQAQVAVIKYSVEELKKRLEESDRRLWTLLGLSVGAILSFAANLIVAWVKK